MGTFTYHDVGKKAVCIDNEVAGVVIGSIFKITGIFMNQNIVFKELPNRQLHWKHFELLNSTITTVINSEWVYLTEKPPACVDCAHMEGELIRPQCGRARMFYDIVLGITVNTPSRGCRNERESDSAYCCGIKAQFFTPKIKGS